MTGSEKQIEELAQDDQFIRWVLLPDEASDNYWHNWQAENYSRRELVSEARQLVIAVHEAELVNNTNPESGVIEEVWQGIDRRIAEEDFPERKVVRFPGWMKYAAAAIVVVAVATTWIKVGSKQEVVIANDKPVQNEMAKAEIVISNNNNDDKIVNLPDGSRIILAKNSSLSYTRLFNEKKREVTLNGEAFFDIAKDATRPFYVYSGNVVTKVLGTSFRIVSDNKADKFTVAVKTGKVTVFRRDKEEEDKDKYVLKPSEQLVFENVKSNPLKQIVANKALIENKLPAEAQFDFESASLPSILEALSNYYSVEIANGNSRTEPCLVTASLSEGSLYDKLDLLHKVTNITYYIKDQTIYVDSKECK